MNTYEEMKNRQQKEFDAFPMGAAFSQQQFQKMHQRNFLNSNFRFQGQLISCLFLNHKKYQLEITLKMQRLQLQTK